MPTHQGHDVPAAPSGPERRPTEGRPTPRGIRAAWSGGAVLMMVASLVVYLRMPPRSVSEVEAAAERVPKTTEEGPVVTDPVG